MQGVVIIDGKTPHAVLLELFTNQGTGTLITQVMMQTAPQSRAVMAGLIRSSHCSRAPFPLMPT